MICSMPPLSSSCPSGRQYGVLASTGKGDCSSGIENTYSYGQALGIGIGIVLTIVLTTPY